MARAATKKATSPQAKDWNDTIVEAMARNKDFAARMHQAVDGNPRVPPHNYGRLGWFTEKLEEKGVKVQREAVRKWFAGEARPRQKAMSALAEIMNVDEAWLALGRSPVDERQKRLRLAEADGVVNVLAGFIQMCGGNPAFPLEGDERAVREKVDLYAIIRGAQYAIHAALAKEEKGKRMFLVPSQARELVILGIVRTGDLAVEFYDLGSPDPATLKASVFTIDGSDLSKFRRITTFSERI